MQTRMPIRLVLALIGFTSVTGQIVLMRELMVVFYGNELSLGLMLANWLLWTAAGSALGGRLAGRVRRPRILLGTLQVFVALTLPLTIVAVRTSRLVYQALPGEILGPREIFVTSLVTLSAFCNISGFTFAAGSRLLAVEFGATGARATGTVYRLEALGSGAGGLLASLVLVPYANSVQIAFLIGFLNLAAAGSLLVERQRNRWVALAGLVALVPVFFSASREIERRSLACLWRGFRVIATQNSMYGNLAVVEAGGARSLFENGLPLVSGRDPAAAEEAVHYALLEHPAPGSLLLIGGGVNGSVAEALRHPTLKHVDYVELDPAILQLVRRFFPEEWALLAANPRTRVHHVDGRLYLRAADSPFDVIILNLPDPQTAQLNRFYTADFFREVAARLSPGGVFSFGLAGAENYISPELADFLRCMNETLRAVFPEVTAFPGETIHFFASNRAGTLITDSGALVKRLKERKLKTVYVREYFIPYRLSADRMRDLEQQIEPNPQTPVNRDFAPVAYYFDTVLWSTRFHADWFGALARIRLTRKSVVGLVAIVLGFTGLLYLLPRATKIVSGRQGADQRLRILSGVCVAAMGATTIGLQILLLLGFQAIYGYVFQELAVLIAGFMLGMAAGAWLAAPRASYAGPVKRYEIWRLALLQSVAAISPIFLYGLLTWLHSAGSLRLATLSSYTMFPILALLSGLMGGYQFPLASRIYLASSLQPDRRLGTLYGLDLVGACIAAVVMSAYWIPVYGFVRTGALMAMLNLVPVILAGLSISAVQVRSPWEDRAARDRRTPGP